MSDQTTERVGVVVIHGVGPTTEGWIDGYLIPEIEKWRAYDSVGGMARIDPDNDLVLQARARDDKWLAVALGNDDDFASFVTAMDMPFLKDDERFSERLRRVHNRDALIEIVNEAFARSDSASLMASLKSHFVPVTEGFRPESEVRRVRDPVASNPAGTWNSFSRYWALKNRDVIVTEMFWADLSHGGTTIVTRVVALIELFLEAPFVLGRAFLGGELGPFGGFIRQLILAANWLMRWPIAGLNVSIFSACFAAMALQPFERPDLLPMVVMLTLLAVALTGLWATLEWQHKKPGMADMGLASFVCGSVLAFAVGMTWLIFGTEPMTDASAYLNVAIRILLVFWFMWTVLNVTGVIVVTLVGLKRWLQGVLSSKEKTSELPGFERILPLSRPAAAIGLGVLIGIIWKLVLAVLGILVIETLGHTDGLNYASCPSEKSLIDIISEAADICQLSHAERQLINVRDLNIGAALAVLFTMYLVHRWRLARIKTYPTAAMDGTLVLPRLIAHPLLLTVLFFLAVANAAIFYVLPMIVESDAPMLLRDWVLESSDASLPPAIGLVMFVVFLVFAAEHSGTSIHIGRDLVDHQYFRDPKWGSVRLQARLSDIVNRLSGGRWGDPIASQLAAADGLYFRRRARIQKRLEALIDEVIRKNAVDRLIFFAHSQGTIILTDYLADHGGMIDDVDKARESLKGVKRIDVVTMGSPLKHIYEHYYGDYEQPYEGSNTLDVDTWINMWRVDDPIGHDINPLSCMKHGDVCNFGIGLGGHMYYWREPAALSVLWSLIENRRACPLPQLLGIDRMPPREVAAS